MDKYQDRYEAGQILSTHLISYANDPNVIVLALPRGGVPVAYEIAKALNASLDVLVVRKLGVPWHEEYAMGAIASGGVTVFNTEAFSESNISQKIIDEVIAKETKELKRRELAYRGDRPIPHFQGKTIILVDDGIATGATIKAAIEALKQKQAKKIIVAVPVSAYNTCFEIEQMVNELICPLRPMDFSAVGVWYENFSETTDDEVFGLLNN